ncbi:MAG: class I SAM-dependent methyltransferase [Anaerolineaceae bacterium]|nr:class I SAM-dependent methyltransferase [Anaerolineaceae bacterium]
MYKKIKKFVFRTFWPIYAFYYLILHPQSYLRTTGWLRSLRKGFPNNLDGSSVPWMNYSVVKFLEEKLTNDLSIFEFGSGYSTLFFAKRVKKVVSVEYDEDWILKMKEHLPENVEVIFQEYDVDGAYCKVIGTSNQKFDIVIVDGRDRVNCIKQSLNALSNDGVLILDDSQRAYYTEGIQFMKEKGFRLLTFEGLKPEGFFLDQSIVFYRDDNCLNI